MKDANKYIDGLFVEEIDLPEISSAQRHKTLLVYCKSP